MYRLFIFLVITLFCVSGCDREEYFDDRSYIEISDNEICEIAGLKLGPLDYKYYSNSNTEITLRFRIKLNDEVIEEYSLSREVIPDDQIILGIGFDGSKVGEESEFILKLDDTVKTISFENFIINARQTDGEYVTTSFSNDGYMNIINYRFYTIENEVITDSWEIEAKLIEKSDTSKGRESTSSNY